MTYIPPLTALQQIQPLNQQITDLVNAGLTPPPIPPMDMQTWWIPKSGKFVRPCFTRLLPDGRVAPYYVKQPQGWPMDINVFDDTGCYARYTDYPQAAGGTGLANSFRLYIDTYQGSKCLGLKLSNRYYDPSSGRIQVAGGIKLGVELHTDCPTFTMGKLGPWKTWMFYQKDFVLGGDLGTQDVMICEFLYTNSPIGFKAGEWFVLTQDSGWAAWYLRALQTDGTWAIAKSAVHNTYIPDTLQVPIVPCDVVL